MVLRLLLVSACAALSAVPPPDLVKRVAAREAQSEAERSHYMYRQSVIIQEYSERNRPGGEYREIREVIFSPSGERTEQFADRPMDSLKRMRMTDEDFRDIREIQPLLLTTDQLHLYETEFKGEETLDGVLCWVLKVRPRQILYGQRLFDGLLWVDQRDFSIIRTEGRAVPQVLSSRPGKENLFPYFTTVREKVGDHWFPVHTHSDDTLQFTTGPVRIRMTIRYRDYKRFQAESKIVPE